MQFFVVLTIFVVLVGEYFVDLLSLPNAIKFLPELLSVVAAVWVIAAGIKQQFRYVAARYWMVFGALALVLVCGIFANNVGTGPTVAGMRYYLRAIPFFLLPAVIDFKSRQLKNALLLLLAIAFAQIPLAIDQRMTVLSEGRFTGDEVVGTLRISSILSIYLIGAALTLTGFFLRGRLSKLTFGMMFLLALIPTMINETKGTLLLLPVGFFAALMVGTPTGQRLKIATWALSLLVIFAAIFIPVYDHMQRNNPYHVPIAEFFTDREYLERYLSKEDAGIGTQRAGRLDGILVPLEYLSRDPVSLAFGLGLGNASHSSLGPNFVGAHYQAFSAVVISSGSVFLLETGLMGIGLLYLLYWLIFRDSIIVARKDTDINGSLSIAWCGITIVMAMATFYKTIHTFESISYLFWFFSGHIAASRMRLAIQTEALEHRTKSSKPIGSRQKAPTSSLRPSKVMK